MDKLTAAEFQAKVAEAANGFWSDPNAFLARMDELMTARKREVVREWIQGNRTEEV